MKNKVSFLLLSLIILACFILNTCENSIVEKWWDEAEGDPVYSVIFNTNGGTPIVPTQTLKANELIKRPGQIQLDEHNFLGWYTVEGNQWDFDNDKMPEQDITLYALWVHVNSPINIDDPDTFIWVTFISNGGTEISPRLVAVGELIIDPSLVNEITPAREGFIFEGWFFDNDSFKFEFYFSQPVSNQDITLYAYWRDSRDLFWVTFNNNGGNPEVVPQGVFVDDFIIEPPPFTGRNSLFGDEDEFIGWFTKDGLKWDFNTFRMPAENITLDAIWSDVSTCTVTFVHVDGNPPGTPHTTTEITVLPHSRISPPAPHIHGYILTGWYFDYDPLRTSEPFRYEFDFREPVSNEDITLYAKWEELQMWTVTFNLDGGEFVYGDGDFVTGVDQITIEVIDGDTVSKPHVRKTNESLADWFTEAVYTNTYNFNAPVTSDMDLYAKWETAHYKVKFDLKLPQDKTSSWTSTVQDVSLNQFVNEPYPDPTTTGWSFMGWYYYDDENNPSGFDNSNATPNNPSLNKLKEWNFDTPLNDSWEAYMDDTNNPPELTLYARWVENVDYMVWVRKGSFTMGTGTGSTKRAHPVEITEGFFINQYEVSQELYDEVLDWAIGKGIVSETEVNKRPSNFTGATKPANPHFGHPVERVSWFDAVFFSNIYTQYINETESRMLDQVYDISSITRAPVSGFPQTTRPRAITNAAVRMLDDPNPNRKYPSGYRLPTEAEWEYAARGGNRSSASFVYAGSNDVGEVAWYYNNTEGGMGTGTRPVGTTEESLKINNREIYDMSGNVYEWCWDRYSSTFYTTLPIPHIDPKGPDTGTERVRRGGCWNNIASNVEVTARESANPANANWVIGFRMVRGPEVIY